MTTSTARDDTARWAQEIRAEFEVLCDLQRRSVEATVRLGKLLIRAKRQLGHGRWGEMFAPDAVPPLPFGQDTAACLMKIARHKVLSNSDNARNLPASWTTLYRLARHPAALVAAGLERGLVHPNMSAHEARTLPAALAGQAPDLWSVAQVEGLLKRAVESWLRHCPAGQEAGIEGLLRRLADGLSRIADDLRGWREKLEQLPPEGLDVLAGKYQECVVLPNLMRRERVALRHLLAGKVSGDDERALLEEVYGALEFRADSESAAPGE